MEDDGAVAELWVVGGGKVEVLLDTNIFLLIIQILRYIFTVGLNNSTRM